MRTYLRYILFLSAFFSFIARYSHAQSYNFINYDVGDGLVHDRVLDLEEDQFGNLWIATLQGGLSKFNGIDFENYTIRDGLASNFVRDILIDRKGDLWAATAMGLSWYNGSKFVNYTVDSVDEMNNSISVITEGGSYIWFAPTEGGIGRFNTTTKTVEYFQLEEVSGNDKIISLTVDHKGCVWLISAVNGLFKFERGRFKSVIRNIDFKGYLLSIHRGKNGILWLGSNKGLLMYDPNRPDEIDNFYKPLKGVFIKSAIVRDTASFWALSAFGMLRIENGTYKPITHKEGFTEARINKIYCDREGTIWTGTDGEGVFKLANETFVYFNPQHGLSGKPVMDIVKDEAGRYYFCTYGAGIDVYDNEIKNVSLEDGLGNTYMSCATRDQHGNLWFGTRGSGVIRYDGRVYEVLDEGDGLIFNAVRCIYTDSLNNIWIGTSNGLSKYSEGKFTNYSINNGLYDNTIWNFQELRAGEILVVTRSGFNYFKNGQPYKGFYEESLFNKRINTAIEDHNGNFWIGYSGHGVLRYNKKTKTSKAITTSDGLTSDLIYNLILDNDNNVVVSSERGIDKIYLDDMGKVVRIKSFGEVEGFENLQTISNSFFKEENGDIWFGNGVGVFKYQNEKEDHNIIEPITYISGLKLFYNEVDWSDYSDSLSHWFSMPQNLKLPYNKNSLVVEYFGNSLINPKEVTYKFRLKGLESDWSPITRKTEAVYTNLAPGTYTFEVMAANNDGHWNTVPASFTFEIVPPFWKESWFFALGGIVIILILKLYNDNRIRANLDKVLTVERIRAEELVKVRKRMARDFHDNMGNQLASITVYANLINLKLKDKSKEIDELLKNIEKHTKSLFNGTKDFIWSIDPESDDLNEIFTYIKDFAEELFENLPLDFYSEKAGLNGESTALPSGYSRQIVLIFKEAITNALKHARADKIYFSLNLKGSEFVIELRDNGTGIDPDNIGKGNGFKNMRSRAKQINCNLEVESNQKPKGTVIKLYGKIESKQASVNSKMLKLKTKVG